MKFKNLSVRAPRPVKLAGASFLALALLIGGLFAGPLPSAHAAPNSSADQSAAARGNSVVSVALRYVGSRYRYGGTSPSGFDCSGFVYYVYNRAGYGLGRSMYSQYSSGRHVSSSQLQPGDIIFFKNTYKRGLSHAAIYVGNGRIVHAANERTGVTVSNLWSPYWSAHYAGAVRPGY